MTEHEALKLMESLQISHDCEIVKTLDFKGTVIKALEDLQQYRAIGTIDEFKALKEKSVAKKPIYGDFDENEAEEIIPHKAVCPICGHEFEFGTWNDEKNHHCYCGQKIDWSE